MRSYFNSIAFVIVMFEWLMDLWGPLMSVHPHVQTTDPFNYRRLSSVANFPILCNSTERQSTPPRPPPLFLTPFQAQATIAVHDFLLIYSAGDVYK